MVCFYFNSRSLISVMETMVTTPCLCQTIFERRSYHRHSSHTHTRLATKILDDGLWGNSLLMTHNIPQTIYSDQDLLAGDDIHTRQITNLCHKWAISLITTLPTYLSAHQLLRDHENRTSIGNSNLADHEIRHRIGEMDFDKLFPTEWIFFIKIVCMQSLYSQLLAYQLDLTSDNSLT